MTDEARRYLLPQHETFWRWCEAGRGVAWRDDTTIAFRQELLRVLRRLSPEGLPPLGAVLLLMAATRNNWGESTREPGMVAGLINVAQSGATLALAARVLGKLDRVNLLDHSLRDGIEAKEAICTLVFEGLGQRTSPAAAQAVIELLDEGLGDEADGERPAVDDWRSGHDALLAGLELLDRGLDRVDPGAVSLRIRIGLDDLPGAADVDLPPAERVRALLGRLRDDDELGGLARLAQELMAAVTLPRAVSDPDELPVGGFSDITNRGPLDRLLLAELAADSLTLAVRVAVNEALYLRRESPPRKLSRRRYVLLESGIRSWGVPRVFATAVALALAATCDRRTENVVLRARGEGVEPVDLTTRKGLIEHLEALDCDAHPGPALEPFWKQAGTEEAEAVLVTSDEVIDDPAFQRALRESLPGPITIAAVDRGGRLVLSERNLRGTRLIREVRMDLDGLFAAPKGPAVELVDRERAGDLPAIFRARPFPLLLPHEVEPDRTWCAGDRGVLALTKDRRLMHWTSLGRGARQIADDVPQGTLWWASYRPLAGQVLAVVGFRDPGGLSLLRIDLNEPHCEVRPLPFSRGIQGVCGHNGALFGIFRDRVEVASETGGEIVHLLELPVEVQWNRGRFFRRNDRIWQALSFDGRTARFEEVLDEKRSGFGPIASVFERAGEGPVGVTASGHLYHCSSGVFARPRLELARPEVVAVSQDGERVVLRDRLVAPVQRQRRVVLSVKSLAVHTGRGDPCALAEDLDATVHAITLRKHLVRMYADEDGLLTIQSRKGHHLQIVWDPTADRIRLRPLVGAKRSDRRGPTFKKVPAPPGTGIELAAATWDDGSRALLDSRGLLHLKSASRSIPEVTLVLHEEELSGWCSDGRVWGRKYFLGDRPGASKYNVFKTAIEPFARRLR